MAIARDSSSPAQVTIVSSNGSTQTATTASFTPPLNSVITVSVACDTVAGNTPTFTVSNTGFTVSGGWTTHVERGDSEGSAGFVAIASGVVTTSAAGTITGTVAGTGVLTPNNRGAIWTDVWTGADTSGTRIEGTNEGSSTSNNITPNVESTGTLSTACRCLGVAGDWNGLGSPTSTDTSNSFHQASIYSAIRAYKASDSSSGTTPTINFDGSGTGAADWNWTTLALKVAAGGDVSVNLTGQSSTVSAGTMTLTHTQPLTGDTGTVSAGTLIASLSIPIIGISNPTAQGTLSVVRETPVTGSSSTVSPGTIIPSLSLGLTGEQVTVSQGTLSPVIEIPLTGQSITISTGTITATGGDTSNVSVELTGQSVTITPGTLVPNTEIALGGVNVTVSHGSLLVSLSSEVSGQVVNISQGTLSPEMAVSLSGNTLSISLGTITPSVPGAATTTRIIWG